jgi:hypothetical protein
VSRELVSDIVASAEIAPIRGSGLVLAEVPQNPFHWWTVAATKEAALQKLHRVVMRSIARTLAEGAAT